MKPPLPLRAYPAEQVNAVRDWFALMQEVETILTGSRCNAEALAALGQLRPRSLELRRAVHRCMSEHRRNELFRTLCPSEPEALPALHASTTITPGRRRTDVDRLVNELLYHIPYEEGVPPADTAAALLQLAEKAEGLLQDGNTPFSEQLEGWRFYAERLSFICAPLYCSKAYLREVEQCLVSMPGAVEGLEKHLEHVSGRSGQSEADARHLYYLSMEELIHVHLAGLTPAGRQELERVAAFLREEPQAHVLLGSLEHEYAAEGIALSIACADCSFLWEAADMGELCFTLLLRAAGSRAEQNALLRELWEAPGNILLRYTPGSLQVSSNGYATLRHPVARRDFCSLRGEWATLHRIFEKHPQLRALLQNPEPKPSE